MQKIIQLYYAHCNSSLCLHVLYSFITRIDSRSVSFFTELTEQTLRTGTYFKMVLAERLLVQDLNLVSYPEKGLFTVYKPGQHFE